MRDARHNKAVVASCSTKLKDLITPALNFPDKRHDRSAFLPSTEIPVQRTERSFIPGAFSIDVLSVNNVKQCLLQKGNIHDLSTEGAYDAFLRLYEERVSTEWFPSRPLDCLGPALTWRCQWGMGWGRPSINNDGG